jgi:hypothetical protein
MGDEVAVLGILLIIIKTKTALIVANYFVINLDDRNFRSRFLLDRWIENLGTRRHSKQNGIGTFQHSNHDIVN